jgi:hypothetical protein
MLIRLQFRFPEVFLGSLLAIAIFAMGAAFWSSQGPASNPHGQEKAANTSNQQHQQEGWWHRFFDPTALFTLCLVIVGGAQLGVFYRQLRLIRESLEPAKAAAEAAKDSANQTKASVDAFRNTERPWLFISDISPAIKDCPGPVFEGTNVPTEIMLSGTIKNYGKAPALVKQISVQLRCSRDNPPGTLSPVPPRFLVLENGGAHTFNIPLGEVPNAGRAAEIANGKQHFWLHFSFIYRDAAGNAHETAGLWSHNFSLGFWDGDYEKGT